MRFDRRSMIADEAWRVSQALGLTGGQAVVGASGTFGLMVLLVRATGAKTPSGGSAADLLLGSAMAGCRDDLVVIADQLQAEGVTAFGHPVGELLALWLAESKCSRCDGSRRSPLETELLEYGDTIAARKIVMDEDGVTRVAEEVRAMFRRYGLADRVTIRPDYQARSVVITPVKESGLVYDCPYCDGNGSASAERIMQHIGRVACLPAI